MTVGLVKNSEADTIFFIFIMVLDILFFVLYLFQRVNDGTCLIDYFLQQTVIICTIIAGSTAFQFDLFFIMRPSYEDSGSIEFFVSSIYWRCNTDLVNIGLKYGIESARSRSL